MKISLGRLLLLTSVIAGVVCTSEADIQAGQFALELSDGRVIRETDFSSVAGSAEKKLQYESGDIALTATVAAHDSFGYRQSGVELINAGKKDVALARVVLLDLPAPTEARVLGKGRGAPVVFGNRFVGVEHPLAENGLVEGRLRCALPSLAPLRPGERMRASLVTGGALEPSQLRRAFLAYLEGERPRRTAPFLHHNTWYNLGYSNSFSEAQELAVIAKLGNELAEKRGVKLDGFVLDDGWDDTNTLWRFHSGWPNGLKAMKSAAAQYQAVPGMWISPWGGYNKPKQARLAAAAPEGFEIRDGGFSLAGPKYYERFRDLCVRAVRDEGVGYFKFDGIGAKATGSIDPSAGRDFDAMLRLIAELRGFNRKLYISQTVGTWASPWWLLHVDNIWRGGEDHDFAGVGSDRQQSITYRDAQVYANVVQNCPLFPLSSVMTHGIIFSQRAHKLNTATEEDFRDDVRAFFGSGTQLQELYLSPELLSVQNWDDLADAANWARKNADVLKDVHWLGGDPAHGDVYGWAAWTPRLGIVTLRNPSAQPASFMLEAGGAFELPGDAAKKFQVKSAFEEKVSVTELQAGQKAEIVLQPFQVLVLEARPVN